MTDRRHQFSAWADQARPRLRRTAYLLCGDWHQAEDLTQDTLVRVYVHWHRIRSDDPDGYARTTLINAYRSVLRRPWRRRETATSAILDDTALHTSASATDRIDQRTALIAALAGLGRSQREVIVLRYWEDLSVADVAAALNVSTGTVKSQAARGLHRLREALAPADMTSGGQG